MPPAQPQDVSAWGVTETIPSGSLPLSDSGYGTSPPPNRETNVGDHGNEEEGFSRPNSEANNEDDGHGDKGPLRDEHLGETFLDNPSFIRNQEELERDAARAEICQLRKEKSSLILAHAHIQAVLGWELAEAVRELTIIRSQYIEKQSFVNELVRALTAEKADLNEAKYELGELRNQAWRRQAQLKDKNEALARVRHVTDQQLKWLRKGSEGNILRVIASLQTQELRISHVLDPESSKVLDGYHASAMPPTRTNLFLGPSPAAAGSDEQVVNV